MIENLIENMKNINLSEIQLESLSLIPIGECVIIDDLKTSVTISVEKFSRNSKCKDCCLSYCHLKFDKNSYSYKDNGKSEILCCCNTEDVRKLFTIVEI